MNSIKQQVKELMADYAKTGVVRRVARVEQKEEPPEEEVIMEVRR